MVDVIFVVVSVVVGVIFVVVSVVVGVGVVNCLLHLVFDVLVTNFFNYSFLIHSDVFLVVNDHCCLYDLGHDFLFTGSRFR